MARARHMTIAEWVRQALAAARRREPLGDPGKKLATIRDAARHAYPTADIGIDRILSFDKAFDGFPGITRIA